MSKQRLRELKVEGGIRESIKRIAKLNKSNYVNLSDSKQRVESVNS